LTDNNTLDSLTRFLTARLTCLKSQQRPVWRIVKEGVAQIHQLNPIKTKVEKVFSQFAPAS